MYTSARRQYVIDTYLLRWGARASAVVLVIAWLALVILEALRSGFERPSAFAVYQAIALMIAFAGYAIGWRKELAGGVIAIAGTLAFFAVHVLTLEVLPGIAAAWFAAPGILYLLAWSSEKASRHGSVRQR